MQVCIWQTAEILDHASPSIGILANEVTVRSTVSRAENSSRPPRQAPEQARKNSGNEWELVPVNLSLEGKALAVRVAERLGCQCHDIRIDPKLRLAQCHEMLIGVVS